MTTNPATPLESPVAGNCYDRYHARNPLARHLMNRYMDVIREVLQPLDALRILEIGCGEGHLTAFIHSVKPNAEIVGADLSERIVGFARAAYPGLRFDVANIYDMDYDAGSFDLVVASDVLQHLHDPQRALREMVRVTKRWALVTVPREPMWRMLNIMRLSYLDHLGNPPGHVQHYSRGDFLNILRGHFRLIRVDYPPPWIVALGRKGSV